MKFTIKVALVLSLFCVTTFAGDQTNGGFVCGDQTNGGKCLVDGSTNTNTFDDKKDTQDDLLIFVRDFLTKIFG